MTATVSTFRPKMSTDPREQPVDPSAVDALALHAQPEDQPSIPPTPDEWRLLAIHNGLYALVAEFGASRVMSWVRNLAAIHGEEV